MVLSRVPTFVSIVDPTTLVSRETRRAESACTSQPRTSRSRWSFHVKQAPRALW